MATPHTPPNPIWTKRLVLRNCGTDVAPLLHAAIDVSIEHLRAWMPWAMDEPRPLSERVELLERGAIRFTAGEDFMYTMLDPGESEVVGGCGLHRRSEPGCLEIGYWVRADRLGRGYATEAARALAVAAFDLPGIVCVQIDCDPTNRSSRRIPEKLGFKLIETRLANKLTPTGQPRDTVVYQVTSVDELPPGS